MPREKLKYINNFHIEIFSVALQDKGSFANVGTPQTTNKNNSLYLLKLTRCLNYDQLKLDETISLKLNRKQFMRKKQQFGKRLMRKKFYYTISKFYLFLLI